MEIKLHKVAGLLSGNYKMILSWEEARIIQKAIAQTNRGMFLPEDRAILDRLHNVFVDKPGEKI